MVLDVGDGDVERREETVGGGGDDHRGADLGREAAVGSSGGSRADLVVGCGFAPLVAEAR